MAVEAQTHMGLFGSDWLPIDVSGAVGCMGSGGGGSGGGVAGVVQNPVQRVPYHELPNGLNDVGSVSQSSVPFVQSLASEVDLQRLEIDLFLKLQNERLRYAIHHQTKHQMGVLLAQIESWAMAAMKEKELELAIARTKTKEFENCLMRAELDAKTWGRAAKEKEAMVMNLNIMLKQVKHKHKPALSSSMIINGEATMAIDHDDAESVCECNSSSSSTVKGERGWCYCGEISCMVILPCKHLSCCKNCEGFLNLCPVCHTVKQATIEVNL
ncbi:hypothetical protein Droror1_Dr00006073 [Drosera rotundifolia]